MLSPLLISSQECFASFRQMHFPEAHVHLVQAKIRLKTEKWIPQQFTYNCSNNGYRLPFTTLSAFTVLLRALLHMAVFVIGIIMLIPTINKISEELTDIKPWC